MFAALGIALAISFAIRLTRDRPELEEPILNLAPWAVGGGLIGARIVHILDNWTFYSQDPIRIIMLNQGGIALYGGIIGGSLAAFIVSQREHLPSGLIADVAAPGLLVGQAIGRIGDMINGEHFTTLTNLPWGTIYLHPDSPGSRFPTHPEVGYELIWDLVVLGVVLWLRQRLPRPGMAYWVYLALYSAGRFLLSFMRLDFVVQIAGLQISQIAALGAFYVAIFAFVVLARRPAPTSVA